MTEHYTITIPITDRAFFRCDFDQRWCLRNEILGWLENTVGAQAYSVTRFLAWQTGDWMWLLASRSKHDKTTVAQFYFRTKQQAMLFKLTWGGE